MKRKNKTKKEIISDIQLVQDADRRRSLIRDIIFPYLVEVNETIGYSKVFLQSFTGLIDGVFNAESKTTTIGDITPQINKKLEEVFKGNDVQIKTEMTRYKDLVTKLKDISVQDLEYAAELPRYIDGFLVKGKDKDTIDKVDINAILG